MVMRWRVLAAFGVMALCLGVPSAPAGAAENGFSNYLQGGYGDFGVAVAPAPGLYVRDDVFLFEGKARATTADGSTMFAAEGLIALNYVSAAWVSDKKVLGARFGAGIYVPLNYVDIDVTRTTSAGASEIGNDDLGLGDVVAIPVSLFWSAGRLHLNLYEAITVPTGGFDVGRTVNAARNYWSFDTVLALTWLDAKRGIEISAAPGVIVNTENPDTNYRTGTEFHVDVMVNKALSPAVWLGLHGYYYQQLTGDSGPGAVFGSFHSRSAGVGPALLWHPQGRKHDVYLIAKWLHDVDAKNRFKGDQVVFTFIKKF